MMNLNFNIQGGDYAAAGQASSATKKTLQKLNVPPRIIKRIVVALYEAEVNVVAHAHEGNISVNISTDNIQIVIEDQGPGIEDIDLAMQEGYSTATEEVRQMGFGAGMGLPNIKRNVDDFKLESTPQVGTKLKFAVNLINQE